MIFFCSKESIASNELSTMINPFIKSWVNATSNDHIFFDFKKVSQHDDGWGSYQHFTTSDDKEHMSLIKSSNPAFTENHDFKISFDLINNFILLNHARKASKSMPISLNQNHPFINESGTFVFVHNGTLNKEAILKLLETKPRYVDNLSDTQLLFSLIKERFSETMNQEELFANWKILVTELKKIHLEKKKAYSMNFLFLIKRHDTKSFNLLYSSLFSNIAGEHYYRLYQGKDNNQVFISSSTVFDYYEEDFGDFKNKWAIDSLANGTIGLIDTTTLEIKTAIIS